MMIDLLNKTYHYNKTNYKKLQTIYGVADKHSFE